MRVAELALVVGFLAADAWVDRYIAPPDARHARAQIWRSLEGAAIDAARKITLTAPAVAAWAGGRATNAVHAGLDGARRTAVSFASQAQNGDGGTGCAVTMADDQIRAGRGLRIMVTPAQGVDPARLALPDAGSGAMAAPTPPPPDHDSRPALGPATVPPRNT
jgi:hypothetical protein